ncbi:hypothetical protein R5M92_05565 [Halomonas sp. Bachu 37]|uniref:H-NS family histone-like protein n=1 Tax=Halomonas kashgarensis TaxID=3084920 RepID=UPI0032180985
MAGETLEQFARNKNVARAAARQLSMEQLNKLATVIQEVIEHKQQLEIERRQQEARKEKKLAEIREAMESAGLSMDDLIAETPRRGRPPKKK